MTLEEKKLTVLLVEDSEEDRFFFERALHKSGVGAALVTANNGKAAIELLEKAEERSKLDTIFLDLKMPLLNGFDVLRWVQGQQLALSIPIVVLSGSAHEKDKLLSAQLGAAGYLVKPISSKILREHLLGLERAD